MEIWGSGGMLRAWGRCLKRGLEVHCRRRDVEGFASRALEACCSRSEEEVWRRAGGVHAWRKEECSSGIREARYSRGVWRRGGVEA